MGADNQGDAVSRPLTQPLGGLGPELRPGCADPGPHPAVHSEVQASMCGCRGYHVALLP